MRKRSSRHRHNFFLSISHFRLVESRDTEPEGIPGRPTYLLSNDCQHVCASAFFELRWNYLGALTQGLTPQVWIQTRIVQLPFSGVNYQGPLLQFKQTESWGWQNCLPNINISKLFTSLSSTCTQRTFSKGNISSGMDSHWLFAMLCMCFKCFVSALCEFKHVCLHRLQSLASGKYNLE